MRPFRSPLRVRSTRSSSSAPACLRAAARARFAPRRVERRLPLMARGKAAILVKLLSSAGTGYFYVKARDSLVELRRIGVR